MIFRRAAEAAGVKVVLAAETVDAALAKPRRHETRPREKHDEEQDIIVDYNY